MANNTRTNISAQELRAMNNHMTKSAKEFSKEGFRYHTTLKTAINILSNESYFWVSNLQTMNDFQEIKLHKNNRERVYGLCFCNTDIESIPLWYMYAGITGRGACIRITPRVMMDFISSITEVYPVEKAGVDNSKPLLVGKDIELQFGWIYYHQNNSDECYYRNNWYKVSDSNSEKADENFFIKEYPWNYEKEFRIVFINKNADFKSEKIAVKIPENIKRKFQLICGPEMNEICGKELENELGVQINHSSINVYMNLLARNKDELMKLTETMWQALENDREKRLDELLNAAKEEEKLWSF